MASFLAKPLLIHEQNSIPGLANRILTKVAQSVAGFSRRHQERGKSDVYGQSGPQQRSVNCPRPESDMRHAAAD